ncbi:hypothetical protein MHTCC0001_09180 [Flavobacteriaceae bacterium MHTCC 0001]
MRIYCFHIRHQNAINVYLRNPNLKYMNTYTFKRLLVLLCLTVVTLTISCSKDDTADSPNLETNQNNPDSEDSLDTDDTANTENNAVEEEIFRLVNAHRASIGKSSLAFNALCNALSKEHTLYMIDQNEISHDNFDNRAQKIYDEETGAVKVAENVASRYRSAQEVFDAWLGSNDHRKNIEGEFSHIGIAAITNTSGTYYYTQIFLKK